MPSFPGAPHSSLAHHSCCTAPEVFLRFTIGIPALPFTPRDALLASLALQPKCFSPPHCLLVTPKRPPSPLSAENHTHSHSSQLTAHSHSSLSQLIAHSSLSIGGSFHGRHHRPHHRPSYRGLERCATRGVPGTHPRCQGCYLFPSRQALQLEHLLSPNSALWASCGGNFPPGTDTKQWTVYRFSTQH